MLMKRAWVNEHVRLARLAGHGLGHERLSCAWWSPQEDAAGHVAAAVLDELGVLKEDDVLLDPLEHVVLAPDVGEPGLDVVGVVDVDTAPGQEPEQQGELRDGQAQDKDDLEYERERAPRERGDPRQRQERRRVDDLARDDPDDGEDDDPADDPGDPELRPGREVSVGEPRPLAPYLLEPELVVRGGVLADEEVELVDKLEPDQDEDPQAQMHLDPAGVEEADERVVPHQRHDED